MKRNSFYTAATIAILFITNMSAKSQVVISESSSATPTPSSMLDVQSTTKGFLIPRMTEAQKTSISSPATGLLIYQIDGTTGFYYNSGSPSTPSWKSFSNSLTGSGGSNRVTFWSNSSTLSSNSTFVWNNTNSRLGIGTSSPSYKLHIADNTTDFSLLVRNTNALGSGIIINAGSDETNQSFNVQNSSGSGDFLVILGNGNVGIGRSDPEYLLQLNGGAYCDGTGAWYAGSDKNIKKDISKISYGLDAVMKMNPISYIHVKDKKNRKQIGFIAQDIKEIIPEVVEGEEGSLAMAYDRLVPVLVNAIKEQQKTINTQEEKIKLLEDRLNAIEKLLSK